MTGRWPDFDIDHKDTDKSNDRIKNLRDATRSVNLQNQIKAKRNNKLGVLGVTVQAGKFRATIKPSREGKAIHLGRFNTLQEASDAYQNAKAIHHDCPTIRR